MNGIHDDGTQGYPDEIIREAFTTTNNALANLFIRLGPPGGYAQKNDGSARFPTHPFAGNSKERAEVGLPGHCEGCAEVGHVKAHPDLGCADVGCNKEHDE